ncbi:MAG: hypothetical protein U9N56_10815 [Actinomycetota bacterium]|nr:hypothetical protein [Actinomycetota bacterium]
MAANPDPKPGRWILPLVILGMIAFTFFFVKELPEASPDTTLVGQPSTTTTLDGTGTTEPGDPDGDLDPETQAYLDSIDEINASLQLLRTEMVAVNDGFDADPREIEYGDAEDRLDTLVGDVEALSSQLDGLTVPTGLQINHDVLTTTIRLAAGSADDALDGLRSSDTGELRRAAVEAFTSAADDFDNEVTNAHNAARS